MRYSPRKTAVILLFVLVASLLLVSSVCAAEAAPSLPPAANSSPSRMQVAVFVNSIYNLDMVQGTYSVDLYLTFPVDGSRYRDRRLRVHERRALFRRRFGGENIRE